MADYIPQEIIINILHRLPVNALLRCTAVCKPWYALITTTQFISSHLKSAAACKNKSSSLLLLRRCITNSERYDLYSDDAGSLTHHSTFQFPFTSINSHFTIVGSCNGLLCLSDDRVFFTNTIILWNPSIKRSVLLPKPSMLYNSHGSFTQCLGFGFDPVANDYKVVRITYVDLVTKPQIEVYRLSDGAWQDTSCLDLDSVIYNRSRHVYVNGASHWIARCMDLYDLIVLFDMSREAFRKIMLPAPVSAANDAVSVRSMELVVFRDSLALAVWNVEQSLCVWILKESWSRRFHFNFTSVSISPMFTTPLWIRENGAVVVALPDGCLVSCNHGGGEVAEFGGSSGSRSDEHKRALHVGSYTSSLVLVNERSSLNDAVTYKDLSTVLLDFGVDDLV